jgi:type II pantothenate kinase
MAAVLTNPAPCPAAGADLHNHDRDRDLLVPLPVLREPYDACTFDYEASGIDAPTADDGVCLREWIDVFRHSTPTFARHIEQGAAHEVACADERRRRAAQFSSSFAAALDAVLGARRRGEAPPGGLAEAVDPRTGRVTCISLCRLRDAELRALGLRDVFLRVKAEEDEAALRLLPGVLRGLDAVADPRRRLELAVRGVLAGNVFDLGAAASAELFASGRGGGADAFCATRDERLLPRPWAVDDLDALLGALLAVPAPAGGEEGREEGEEEGKGGGRPSSSSAAYDKAVLFADNAGSDVLLGLLPFARELLRLGVRDVVLAANAHPTLNDTTAAELAPLLRRAAAAAAAAADGGGCDPDAGLLPRAVASGRLRVVASGSGLPVGDLRHVSRELAAEFEGSAAAGRVLLVLEGMGRGIETNLRASFSCDALRIGVIKHPEVARCLKGRLYDPVVRFTRGERI